MSLAAATPSSAFGWHAGLKYGALGMPLAFAALPLYVVLPNHYATALGMPLAWLGALLLGARLWDAAIDPLLGRWSDRLFAHSAQAVLQVGAVAAVLLALGFTALFLPPVRGIEALSLWAAASLLLTYTAYSLLSISHQSWAARLGGDEAQRSRIVGWREGWALAGVVLASIVPVSLGIPATIAILCIALASSWRTWSQAPRPQAWQPDAPGRAHAEPHRPVSLVHPFAHPAYRRLLAVFMLNGIASAVPATLVLFFVQDRLQAPPALQPVFLGSYFLCAALSIPLWLRLVRSIGLARSWLVGMVLAMGVFLCAGQLGPGDDLAFGAVCALSGAALGTDLILPSAMLAGLIQRTGDSGHAEGSYFGWWNFATKLNLALAAGLALPLLSLFGYAPGSTDPQALRALGWAYCLLPCVLKAAAALCLYVFVIRSPR